MQVWPFSFCMPDGALAGECRYAWGTTESHVWQGVEQRVPLSVGPATVSLIVDPATTPHNSAERHVDVVVLTRNQTDVELRRQRGGIKGNTPFDGWLTQAGDVFIRVCPCPYPCRMPVPPACLPSARAYALYDGRCGLYRSRTPHPPRRSA